MSGDEQGTHIVRTPSDGEQGTEIVRTPDEQGVHAVDTPGDEQDADAPCRHGNQPPCPRCLAERYRLPVWNNM